MKFKIPEYQQRVIDERDALDAKIAALINFFETSMFAGLDEAERSRLANQARFMCGYSDVLDERIYAFMN